MTASAIRLATGNGSFAGWPGRAAPVSAECGHDLVPRPRWAA